MLIVQPVPEIQSSRTGILRFNILIPQTFTMPYYVLCPMQYVITYMGIFG